jgi:hypothetical protein
MNKQEAKNLIENTFSSDFDADKYQKFVVNLFKKYSESNSSPTIKNAYQAFITKYTIIGTFEDSENNKIDILEVHLSKESTLERARTAQRNFVAEYLKSRNKEAALVAFISPNNKEWRLSFVKLEHTLEVIDKKIKAKEEITLAKRWSFLVGEYEGSHTAQSRFVNLLMSDKEPNLAEFEVAFDIEIVTKEFFKKYTELFFQFKEKLDELLEKDEIIKKDFKEKEISTVDFAKKTLGQIVFLYFLQKKGWFGVPADKKWGEGPKKFIRVLFERREKYGSNFFNDILEPLFYEALAQDRGKESIYPRLNNCRMPFLNGGLFEPMNDYKWETTDIIIPDELFSNNIKTKEGDIGTGILDVFDRYNFTVNENEPLEKEVAVDPEMLGKVFENLLDIKDRKSKGAFYTPREIVHYMCQESLINYLETETKNKILREDLEFLIHKGDRIIENDKVSLEKTKGGKYPNEYYKIFTPDSIIANVILLNELLKNIKVADPAVGSGAFPLGMINEIVRARKVLNIYLNEDVSDYELKKHAITHSIYGVDIDSGAVDIAKLRLWLALVVDEDTPHPLPNLEHKIMQGNSLISEYEGIKLFDDSILDDARIIKDGKDVTDEKISLLQKEYFNLHANKQLTATKEIEIKKEIKSLQRKSKDFVNKLEVFKGNASIFDVPEKRKIAQEKTVLLQRKIKEYISESRRSQKQNLKEEIDNLKWDLIEVSLEEQNKLDEKKLKKIRDYKKSNTKPFFIWKLEFSDVFKKKGGFDIVIGNPPYVSVKKISIDNKKLFSELFETGKGRFNLFTLFLEKGQKLLKSDGVLSYILPEVLYTNSEYRYIRKYLLEKTQILSISNFSSRVFEASVDTSVIVIKNGYNQKSKIKVLLDLSSVITTIKQAEINDIILTKNPDSVKSILDKINLGKDRLSNIIEVQQGIIYSGQKKEDVFSNKKFDSTYKKILDGRDISKYSINYNFKKENRYIKYTRQLHRPREERLFLAEEKIIFPRRSMFFMCTIDFKQFYLLNTAYICLLTNSKYSLKYILGILNSKVVNFLYSKTYIGWQITIPAINALPIPEITPNEQKPFIDLVDQILEITSQENYDFKNSPIQQRELEKKIDEMVYELYGLTKEEIGVIEESFNKV